MTDENKKITHLIKMKKHWKYLLIIIIYLFSVLGSYKSTQDYYASRPYRDPTGIDVFLVICPLVNTITFFVLIIHKPVTFFDK